MLDYGFSFMNTKIYIDNESIITIVKNPKLHGKTKHIEIRHHFIRDYHEKKLIQTMKIHTDQNVADVLTKAFDVSSFNFLVASIGLPNLQKITLLKECHDSMIVPSMLLLHHTTNGHQFTMSNRHQEQASPKQTAIAKDFSNPLIVDKKPVESEGFHEIIDFLNANPVCYALTVNPTIYTSCIKQFWNTAKVKTICDKVQMQALVDGKKVVVTEVGIRRALCLKDDQGTECLPNATIFAELQRIGYENLTEKLTFYKAYFSPQWKFFVHTILQCISAMASAIICLTTNRLFNFSKYTFDHMVKRLEGGVTYLMYPRFVQVFINKQVDSLSKHKETYDIPSYFKKIFANMRRKGNKFSGRVTPSFPTKLESMKSKKKTTKVSHPSSSLDAVDDEPVTHISSDPQLSGEDRLKLAELLEICTKLPDRVLALETEKTTQALEISTLKKHVKKLEKKVGKITHKLKRLYKVGVTRRVQSFDDEVLGDEKDASKQGRSDVVMDEDKKEVTAAPSIHIEVNDAPVITSIPTTSTIVKDAAIKESNVPVSATVVDIATTKAVVSPIIATTTTTITDESRPKAKGVILQEPSEYSSSLSASQLP
ncbi:hypothetical protein Tco_0149272 [Tanacetum coccineum]